MIMLCHDAICNNYEQFSHFSIMYHDACKSITCFSHARKVTFLFYFIMTPNSRMKDYPNKTFLSALK